jgi:hypothetical protein
VDLLAQEEIVVKLDLLVSLVLLELWVNLVHLDFRDLLEKTAKKELRDPRATKVCLVFKECLDLPDHLEKRDPLEMMAPLENLVSQVPEDCLVMTEIQVHQVSLDLQVLGELRERKVSVVHKEKPVHPVLQVHLVRALVWILPHLLPCLVKVIPRDLIH